jgi:hypothetical protein
MPQSSSAATNFFRDAFLRMISKRLAIDHAKSKCSAYVGAGTICRESVEQVNAKNHTLARNVKRAAPQIRGHAYSQCRRDLPTPVVYHPPQ